MRFLPSQEWSTCVRGIVDKIRPIVAESPAIPPQNTPTKL